MKLDKERVCMIWISIYELNNGRFDANARRRSKLFFASLISHLHQTFKLLEPHRDNDLCLQVEYIFWVKIL